MCFDKAKASGMRSFVVYFLIFVRTLDFIDIIRLYIVDLFRE